MVPQVPAQLLVVYSSPNLRYGAAGNQARAHAFVEGLDGRMKIRIMLSED
jgi:hypothetical protein